MCLHSALAFVPVSCPLPLPHRKAKSWLCQSLWSDLSACPRHLGSGGAADQDKNGENTGLKPGGLGFKFHLCHIFRRSCPDSRLGLGTQRLQPESRGLSLLLSRGGQVPRPDLPRAERVFLPRHGGMGCCWEPAALSPGEPSFRSPSQTQVAPVPHSLPHTGLKLIFKALDMCQMSPPLRGDDTSPC